MNILIIEDDIFLAKNLEKVFKKNKNFNRVKSIKSYDSFLKELFSIKDYDIILVDIILWKDNYWIEIVKNIRWKNIKVPIVIMSWINDLRMIKEAFDIWVNDYICKPFRLAELELRILKWFNDFLFTNKDFWNNFIKYDLLKYDFQKNIFYINNKKIILSKLNKYVLLLFISKSEILLSEIYLIEKIWWDPNLTDRNLRVIISRLKASLKEYWIDWWIKNIRWEWYILEK